MIPMQLLLAAILFFTMRPGRAVGVVAPSNPPPGAGFILKDRLPVHHRPRANELDGGAGSCTCVCDGGRCPNGSACSAGSMCKP
jgi:hypothetical protein